MRAAASAPGVSVRPLQRCRRPRCSLFDVCSLLQSPAAGAVTSIQPGQHTSSVSEAEDPPHGSRYLIWHNCGYQLSTDVDIMISTIYKYFIDIYHSTLQDGYLSMRRCLSKHCTLILLATEKHHLPPHFPDEKANLILVRKLI